MAFETLRMDRGDGVVTLTIDRESAANSMNPLLASELMDAANLIDGDDSVRAVVLTAAGDRFFCSGGDLRAFAGGLEDGSLALALKRMTTNLHAAVSRLVRMRAPVIGVVNGMAAGAGLSLICACDLVIASDAAKFTMAYTKAGLTPDGSSTFFLSRIVGLRRASEMALLNPVLSAETACEWGLVNLVVPVAGLQSAADEWATTIANGPTAAFGTSKRLLLNGTLESLETQMEQESRAIVEMVMFGEAKEGIEAFLQKRKPRFAGS